MCYVLTPSDLLAYIVVEKRKKEIFYKELKAIRHHIESKINTVFVEITSRAVADAVDSYPDIYEMDDVKITINKDNLDNNHKTKAEFKQSANNLPYEYKQMLREYNF